MNKQDKQGGQGMPAPAAKKPKAVEVPPGAKITMLDGRPVPPPPQHEPPAYKVPPPAGPPPQAVATPPQPGGARQPDEGLD
eukprot:10985089-Lingulodinium_polyedra.AAC.1